MGAPKMTDKTIDQAVKLLDGWAGKLTWDRYLAVLEVEIGHKYTKAAMLRHVRIKAAWDHAKENVRETTPGAYGNIGMEQATARIHELEARVERLTRENQSLLEQFVRWSHNATRRGLSLADLDKALPYVLTKEIR